MSQREIRERIALVDGITEHPHITSAHGELTTGDATTTSSPPRAPPRRRRLHASPNSPSPCGVSRSVSLSFKLPLSPSLSPVSSLPHPSSTVESLTLLPHFTHTPLSLARRQPRPLSPPNVPSLPSAGPSRCPAVPPRLCSWTTRTALSLPGGPLRARQPPSVPLPPAPAVAVSFPISRPPFALSLPLASLTPHLYLCLILASLVPAPSSAPPRPSTLPT